MKNLNRKLMVEQLDRKMAKLHLLKETEVPSKGWLNAVRTTLNMSLVQLGKRLSKTSVAIKEIEEREQSKTITLKKLIEVGEALDLQFVYGFVPKEASVKNMIEQHARHVAREVVMRTSHTMKLEEQENREERVQQAITERAEQLQREMPKYLWD